MPDPVFLTDPVTGRWYRRLHCKFGGLPVPVFGTTLPYVDLNDLTNWRLADSPKIDNGHVSNKASQLAQRAKGVWTSSDFVGRKITLPVWYDETGGIPFTRAKAMLTQAGEQYLTFDDLTGIRVKVNSFAEMDFLTGFPDNPGSGDNQFTWKGALEFLSRNAFAEDLFTQQFGPITSLISTTTPNTGSANFFNITYNGHAYGEPIYTLTIPSSNTAPVTRLEIENNASTELLVINFSPVLAAGVSHTVIIDATGSVVTADGVSQNFAGSFPLLYPNPATGFTGQTQNFGLRIVVSSGSLSASASFKAQWQGRFEI